MIAGQTELKQRHAGGQIAPCEIDVPDLDVDVNRSFVRDLVKDLHQLFFGKSLHHLPHLLKNWFQNDQNSSITKVQRSQIAPKVLRQIIPKVRRLPRFSMYDNLLYHT